MYKNKLEIVQEKLKEAERNRQYQYYENEKEKAKYQIEKENIAQKMEDLKEKITKYERETTKLQKDN